MPPSDLLAGYPIVVTMPVAWGDLDALGHVNNTVYFRRFEDARIAYLAAIELTGDLRDGGVGPILASTHCRFRRPVEFPDTVRTGARVSEVADDRFTMEYRIVSERLGEVAAEGGGVVVSYDYGAKAKAPLPDRVRDAIRRLEEGS